MAVRKLKPVAPGQRLQSYWHVHEMLLHPCQRSLSFTVSVIPVVETTPVR